MGLKRTLATDIESFQADENLGFKRWFNSQLAEGETFVTSDFDAFLLEVRRLLNTDQNGSGDLAQPAR